MWPDLLSSRNQFCPVLEKNLNCLHLGLGCGHLEIYVNQGWLILLRLDKINGKFENHLLGYLHTHICSVLNHGTFLLVIVY